MKILNSSPKKTWSSNPNQPINATPNRNGKKKSEGTRRLHRWWEARYWPLPHHSWPDRCDGVFGAVFDGVKEGRNFQPVYQWSFLVPLIGGRWYISPQLAVYTTYIPLIYGQLGTYISPTTYDMKGTRNSCWNCIYWPRTFGEWN